MRDRFRLCVIAGRRFAQTNERKKENSRLRVFELKKLKRPVLDLLQITYREKIFTL